MTFKTIKITKRKRTYKKRKNNNFLKNFIIYSILFLFILWLSTLWYIYKNYIKPLPSISKLEEIDIKESSIIYDSEWNELYTIFWNEKRTFLPYDKISKNMINAIVAWEDKTFFENPWVDLKWIIRALYNYIVWKTVKIEWTSTISQQLIRNTFLTNERKIERKIKELYLSYQMTKKYSKEKILELYLNKISFWSNAFGVEQASLTFFWKHANNLNVLESAILASLPKWPTYYSPYNNYERLVWNLYIYPKEDSKNIINLINKENIEKNKEIIDEFINVINSIKIEKIWGDLIELCNIDKGFLKKKFNTNSKKCIIIEYSNLLSFLNSIKIEQDWQILEYQTWRKDFILQRMLEDNYITWEEYKKSLIDSIWFEFKEYKEKIKYPHFVMYVKEYLAKKYWEQILEEWWLKIYTTIKPDLQQKAEEIIKKYTEINSKKFDANNWALVSIDNETWDILAFVWWSDYFNKEIDGNVNMITSKRQPWSTFKSFVYALAIENNPLSPHTPIYDLPTKFPWDYEPKNYDWKFLWKMDLMTALNYSRNIPAIKLYFLAWEQEKIIEYLKKIWVKSLNKNFYYWAPLAIWSWEMTPLELAKAYSVFPNLWISKEINPILKILDSKWILVEQRKIKSWNKVLSEKTAFIMNYILSNTSSRPNDFWNKYLALDDRKTWAKTWTSNKLFIKNWKKQQLPWDLWTVWYTPQITTVVWVWNTDWKALNRNRNWLEWAWPIWKEFMEYVHKPLEKLDFKEVSWWFEKTKISKISWLLVWEDFDKNFVVDTYFTNAPEEYDESLKEVEVDMLCNWKVTENTPFAAIKKWYYIAFKAIDDRFPEWQESIDNWINDWWAEDLFENIPNIITKYKDEACKRNPKLVKNAYIQVWSDIKENEILHIWKNKIKIWYKSNNILRYLEIALNWNVIKKINVEWLKSWVYNWDIVIPEWYNWNVNMTITAVDTIYFWKSEEKEVIIAKKDKIWPEITITNPEKDYISIYDDQFFNLRINVKDRSPIRSTNVYVDWNSYKIWIKQENIVLPINKDSIFEVWEHTIKIESIDNDFNKSSKEIKFEIMKR